MIKKAFARIGTGRALKFLIALIGVAIFICIIELVGLKSIPLIETGLFAMTPLALAAVGECVNQKAGVINIGLEGIFLLASLTGVYGAHYFGSGVSGLLIGLLTGALIGFLFGVLSTYGRADQIIAGMGIVVFGIGFVANVVGIPGLITIPEEYRVPTILTPLGNLSPLIFATIIIALLVHVLLHRTIFGLRVKAAGEKPEAVDVAGSSVNRIRVFTATFGGALCGLGGAFMPLAWFGVLPRQISGGRGFIALACVVVAGLEPLGALSAAFIFGFTEGLAGWIAVTPGVKEVVPFYFVSMIPYIATIAIVATVAGKRRFPKAIGKPYVRE